MAKITNEFVVKDPVESQTRSCIPQSPLIKLGKGQAPELDYNLPQSSCFEAKGYLSISIPKDYWRDKAFQKPKQNYFGEVKELNQAELSAALSGARLAYPRAPYSVEALKRQQHFELRQEAYSALRGGKDDIKGGVSSGKDEIKGDAAGGKDEIKNETGTVINPSEIGALIDTGMQPVGFTNLYGAAMLDFVPEPITPDPRLVICLQYRVCSFLGDYGAGSTVKTFSLLPGEKTEISIKTYKHLESVRKKAENVLDSFSESSTQELEKLVQEEIKDSFEKESTITNQSSVSQDKTRNWQMGGGLSLSIPFKKANLGISGQASTGGTSTNSSENIHSSTLNSTISSMIDTLERALDKHVSQSSAVREVSVNTEQTETVREGSETSTTRKLENINSSRVLNFVFRQLLQEYLTITYLEDVKFIYSNGYAETKQIVGLDGLPGLLNGLFKTEAMAAEVRNAIMAHLCHVTDHEGAKHSFLEHVHERVENCCGVGDFEWERDYCRKRRSLSQTWQGITVPGIILNTKRRILRTDSVITEALLGQGEALDCYNQKLQEAAAEKAQLENRRIVLENMRLEQSMKILDLIDDPQLKAELYKKVFGDCCAVPQSGCCCTACSGRNA